MKTSRLFAEVLRSETISPGSFGQREDDLDFEDKYCSSKSPGRGRRSSKAAAHAFASTSAAASASTATAMRRERDDVELVDLRGRLIEIEGNGEQAEVDVNASQDADQHRTDNETRTLHFDDLEPFLGEGVVEPGFEKFPRSCGLKSSAGAGLNVDDFTRNVMSEDGDTTVEQKHAAAMGHEHLQMNEAAVRRQVRESVSSLADEFERAVDHTSEKTPAQLFLQENRERLLQKAEAFYVEREARELTTKVEEDWAYYHEPVVRPPKGHLWSMTDDRKNDFEAASFSGNSGATPSTSSSASASASFYAADHEVRPEDFQFGVLPSVELLKNLLLQEEAVDVRTVDLAACGRRDIGTAAILATGQTSDHSIRMGRLLARTIRALEVPFVTPYCWQQRKDEWIHCRLGPIAVHIFTPKSRPLYDLEHLWTSPETFFRPGDFPHFVLDSMEYALRNRLTEPDDRASELLEKVFDSESDSTQEIADLLDPDQGK
ncbi:unnamed protein product [Amoebophrya sp. A25]|nr:unnamed protein product [Amoebophrya sp. A25]|eukprot:GSA25T00014035001.1